MKFSIRQKNKGFQKSYMKVGVKKSPRGEDGSHGEVEIEETNGTNSRQKEHHFSVFVHGSMWSGGRGENMFLSFFLDGWSVPRRALGKCEVLTLLTASGRSDQSHRLAPVNITPFSCQQTNGKGGKGKENTTHSRKGALTTARPLLVIAPLTGETCAKNFADTCYTASGPRAESQP